ncbi:GMC oxidoreductase [Aestuariibaculum sediminum]|uniref:GMC family oxidoreductase n=1 Tax=Aestuariibaculum sediminum TaxID=2770637 RepID=A0A8J6QJU6_9FLAO|nr:GMC family oxidoreductase [Aestuariibaculum sediminum]MBD0832944.1 GMC family oxidoreductase [Aestuariibaculum sediminum]
MSLNNLNASGESYDAIVVGTGISGGWAAKELCENGLKTLVLERGKMINHPTDYHTAHLDPWDLPNAGAPTQEQLKRKHKQKRSGNYIMYTAQQHYFVDDLKHPYNEDRRFDWIRGYHVGGRSIMWGRQSYRLSDIDFEANKKDGHGVDWPVRYKDIAPWYSHIEKFIGVSGEALGLKQLPDSEFLKPMELNCVEKDLKEKIAKHFDDRVLTIGRCAHVTEGTKPGLGRTTCQYRSRCMRGCPYGAYFSSNSSTLPTAEATGNMTLKANSVVSEVIYDNDLGKATGVKVIDAETKEAHIFKANIIFLCASAMASAAILLQSKSKRFPNGLGNDSGELGHNIMDHHFRVGARATVKGFEDKINKGRRPNGIYIPRFRNIGGKTNTSNFLRGYGYQGGASRNGLSELVSEIKYGEQLKEEILKPGTWSVGLIGFGETLPNHNNRMYLNYDKKDEWGLPTITFDADFGENELAMREDMKNEAVKILKAAGYNDVQGYDQKEGRAMGLGIHEMGTARMGHDPKTSVLNKHNQIHACKNVFVTDGAFMTSAGCQNPSLTYMAFTARAANYAADAYKKNKL